MWAGNIGELGEGVSDVDNRAPDRPMSIEILNGADDLLDFGELSAKVTVKVRLVETAKVGEKLHIDVNGDGVADAIHTLTIDDLTGFALVEIEGSKYKVDEINSEVTATGWVVDKAGNPGVTATDTSGVIIDVKPDPAVIVIGDDINNDAALNAAELGNSTKINTVITIDGNHKIGDTLYVFSSTHSAPQWQELATITQQHIDDGEISYSVDRPAEGETLVVKTRMEGIWGKISDEREDTALIDTTGPTVTIETDTLLINKDDVALRFVFDEAPKGFNSADVKVVGGTLSQFKKVNDKTWKAVFNADNSNVEPEISIADGAFSDRYENAGFGDAIEFELTTIKPDTVSIRITDDVNDDAVLSGAELGAATTVSTLITLGDNHKVGDSLKVWHNGPQGGWELVKILDADDIKQGEVVHEVPRLPEGETVKVKARVTSQYKVNGNSSEYDMALVDTQGPELTITTQKNKISDLPVGVTFDFNEKVVGFDLSDIQVAGGALSGFTQQSDTQWTAVFTSDKSTADPSIEVANNQYTDSFGNNGTGDQAEMVYIPRPDSPDVEIKEDSNNDGVLNADELKGVKKLTGVVKFGDNNVVGDVVHISSTNGFKNKHTLTKSDIKKGKLEFEFKVPAETQEVDIEAYVTRKGADNSDVSTPDSALVDTLGPVVTISTSNTRIKDQPVTLSFQFNEAPVGFKQSDVSVKGGKLSNFEKINDTLWQAKFTSHQVDTAHEITIENDQFEDLYGNDGVGDSLDLKFIPDAILNMSKDQTVNEGDYAYFNIDVESAEANSRLRFDFKDISAIADEDYSASKYEYVIGNSNNWNAVPANGIAFDDEGNRSLRIRIKIHGDTKKEDLEVFAVQATLEGVINKDVVLEREVTIKDRPAPELSISKDVSVLEGNYAIFTVKATNVEADSKFKIALQDISATKSQDYQSVIQYSTGNGNWKKVSNNEIAFSNAGDKNIKLRVKTLEDREDESTESFKVKVTLDTPSFSDKKVSAIAKIENKDIPNELVANDDTLHYFHYGSYGKGMLSLHSFWDQYRNGNKAYGLMSNEQELFNRLTKNDHDANGDSFEVISIKHQGVELTFSQAEVNAVGGIPRQDIYWVTNLGELPSNNGKDAAGNHVGETTLTYTIRDEHGKEATADVKLITSYGSPIILDLDDDGVETISKENGVIFDLDADGRVDKTGWVGKDDGLLVRDINGDGFINDGSELFGEFTKKDDGSTFDDGYQALAALDTNFDGVINAEDQAYSELRVWQDKNQDGITDEGELLSLAQANVSEISVIAREIDEMHQGNKYGLESTYKDLAGNDKASVDVWFAYESDIASPSLDLADLLEDDTQVMNSIEQYLTNNTSEQAGSTSALAAEQKEVRSASCLQVGSSSLVEDQVIVDC